MDLAPESADRKSAEHPDDVKVGDAGADAARLSREADESGWRPDDRQHWQRSLFGEIIDWMFAPLLILWPVSMAIQYSVAASLADAAYDRELESRVQAVARQVVVRQDRLEADLPPNAIQLVSGDEEGAALAVRTDEGVLLAGSRELPWLEMTPEQEHGRVYFTKHEALEMRAAYMFVQPPGTAGTAVVQVAEPEAKRKRLASEIIGRVLASQFILVPIAVLLVWFGLAKGIAPLNQMRSTIHRRRANDLSPIDTRDAPQEIHPFLASINDLMGRLSASITSQRRFIADAAHQMRTPLAGLKTQAELVLRQERLDDAKHSIAQIAASADRATHMVNQLLALARAESDNQVVLRPVDLAAITREVAGEWVGAAMERRIDFGYEGPSDVACVVDGSGPLLREMLSNLIDNALRYTPAGGHVTVRLQSGEAGFLLQVEDSGIGIPEAERALVFERFFRGPNAEEFTRGSSTPGSGLGLAIVKRIVEQHGAEIRIEDRPADASGALPEGTIFTIALPLPRQRS